LSAGECHVGQLSKGDVQVAAVSLRLFRISSMRRSRNVKGQDMPHADVAIIMGSQSDWPTMRHAAETLESLGVCFEKRIVSAHRTPERLYEFARGAREAGFKVIIAGAGGAAHLPGMTAAVTPLPVFGVPVESKALSGQDSLLSIVQMPAGIPVGTLAIGRSGAVNAALLAAAVLALSDPALAGRLDAYRARQTEAVADMPADNA
jgi:5-(carboxyamino)imidazole ribonucleotide mutase